MRPTFTGAVGAPPGPLRTAAVAAWFQALYEEPRDVPILVGGAAVELYTGGAYRTGDFDFVGQVPNPIAERLTETGFRRSGRHWVHDAERLFIEFPGRHLDAGERDAIIEVGPWRIRILGLEDILVDRLAAWQFWRSHVDGVNAYLLHVAQQDHLDHARLEARAVSRGAVASLTALVEFVRGLEGAPPRSEALERWAREKP